MDDPAEAWRSARTFAALCALGARFVRGEVRHFPGWGAPDLDLESDALLTELEAAMRGGFLTTASQPGRPFAPGHDGRSAAQRAFVCGFAGPAAAARLARAAAARGLWCDLPAEGAPPYPVGLADGTPYLFAGHAAAADELALFADDLDPAALADLGRQAFVWLVDPVWGRRDTLRGALAEAFPPSAPSL